MLLNGFKIMKSYWFVLVIGAGIVGMMWFTSNQTKAIAELELDVATTKGLIADAEKTRSGLAEEFNTKKYQEKIKERTVSAQKIGKQMIEVDDALTAFYKSNKPLPKDKTEKDRLFSGLEAAKAKNVELTGAKEADHIKTWQLNPEWSLSLESVITYQDTEYVPVVFSMKTKDGKAAGLVYARYNVNKQTLEDINRYYTTDGLKDEIDVGGV